MAEDRWNVNVFLLHSLFPTGSSAARGFGSFRDGMFSGYHGSFECVCGARGSSHRKVFDFVRPICEICMICGGIWSPRGFLHLTTHEHLFMPDP